MKKKLFILGCVMSLGLLSTQAATTYYDGKISVGASNPIQYGGDASKFIATNIDNTSTGSMNMVPWVQDWQSASPDSVFSLNTGDTFTFSGQYSLSANTDSPSFGIYFVNADSISGNNGEAIGFLMNNTNVRTTGPGTFSLATGGNSGGWNAILSLGNPTLTNTWTITYVVGESLSFTIGGITYDFSANIPSWENISIGFRIYNASTTLTLSNFDYSISSIPEPSTLTLLTLSGIGITAFLLRKRRMQAKS
ncbi:MAG: PEP-CTERM sorting domain-containing protein [Verrucomicrobiales bacterium]|jgi:hypothetical protein|nr:PEP-CTERM sorting domain-containing protein [Verrucomicrobiales bacterium]